MHSNLRLIIDSKSRSRFTMRVLRDCVSQSKADLIPIVGWNQPDLAYAIVRKG